MRYLVKARQQTFEKPQVDRSSGHARAFEPGGQRLLDLCE